MTKIDVYIITRDLYDIATDISHLMRLFSGDIFNVQEVNLPLPENFILPEVMNKHNIYEIKWCLNKSYSSYSDRGILIVDGNSISNISPRKLEDLMSYVYQKQEKYDLFYLCRWQDECQKITDIARNDFFNIQTGRTYGPHGMQVVYFSNSGRDLFLGKKTSKDGKRLNIDKGIDHRFFDHVTNGNIICYCTLNNIFEYDITRATHNFDYDKTSLCRKMDDRDDNNNQNDTNNLGYLWFLIVVIIAVLLAFAIVKIGR